MLTVSGGSSRSFNSEFRASSLMFSAFSIKRVFRFPLGARRHQYAALLMWSIGIVEPSPSSIRVWAVFTRELHCFSRAVLSAAAVSVSHKSLKPSSSDCKREESLPNLGSSSINTGENLICSFRKERIKSFLVPEAAGLRKNAWRQAAISAAKEREPSIKRSACSR